MRRVWRAGFVSQCFPLFSDNSFATILRGRYRIAQCTVSLRCFKRSSLRKLLSEKDLARYFIYAEG